MSKFCFYSGLLTVGFLLLYNCLCVFVCIEGLNCLTELRLKISHILNKVIKYILVALLQPRSVFTLC